MGDDLSRYAQALDYLFVRTAGPWRLGLERTAALLHEIGDPHRGLRIIHVAGTNGKGSVCAMLEAVLRGRGFRVAKYTSPHLIDFRERILIDGAPASEDAVVAFVDRWTPTIERLGATFFEATTAMAFSIIADAAPDVAIVEVGLGGRLDSTNVVDPMAAIVTNVGFDHTEYLGDTRDAIAREKAGIFKPDRAAIVGEADPRMRRVLAQLAAAARGAPRVEVADAWPVSRVRVGADGTAFTAGLRDAAVECRTSMIGAHQAANAATALAALGILPPPFATPAPDAAPLLTRARVPGRFQRWDRYIFDVAHNRDGAGVCAAALSAVAPSRPCVALVSVLRDKDWRGMLAALAPAVDSFVLTAAPTAPAPRAWDPAEAGRFAEERGWKVRVEPDFDRALDVVSREAATVLITGSFHTVGDAMSRLQVSPLAE